MKRLTYLMAALFLIVYLALDYQAYYYGFGKGFLSKKIPESFSISILFAGSDLGYQGMIIDESDIGGVYLVCKDEPIYLGYDINIGKKILVKRILGYYFNEQDFIVKILEADNKITNIEITPKVSEKDPSYIDHYFNEVSTIDEKKLKYIDLDKSILYFQYFKLIKNLSLGVFLTLVIVLIIRALKNIYFVKSKE